jgi:hypothetical protein
MKALLIITSTVCMLLLQTVNAQTNYRHAKLQSRWLEQMILSSDHCKRGNDHRLDSIVCVEYEDETHPAMVTYFSYDESGRLQKDSLAQWEQDPSSRQWVQHWQIKNEYFYNNIGEVETKLIISWDFDAEEWSRDTIKQTHYYDNNGRLEFIETAYYEEDNGGWQEPTMEFLYYGATGLLEERIVGIFDGFELSPIGRMLISYDANLPIEQEFEFTFDGGENWFKLYKEIFDYDQGQHISTTTQFYELETEEYENVQLQYFNYDAEGRLIKTEEFIYVGEWFEWSYCTYYYSGTSSTQIPPTNEGVKVKMANPFREGDVLVEGISEKYQIRVINTMGQTIQLVQAEGNQTSLSAIQAPGIYVLCVENDKRIVAKHKFVVIH